jgi:hypothetical protein
VIAMRQRKRLSRTPHPRSVFARRHERDSLGQSKHRVRAAHVRIDNEDVLVVEVKASLVADVFEAQLAISAIELTCGTPAVLWAFEPCGCRELFGRREHIWSIDAMPAERLEWRDIEIDFARPVLLVQPRGAPN